MNIDLLVTWQPMCCAEHSAYAETPTKDGGRMRIKRDNAGGLVVMRFGADNRAIDTKDGVPVYVQMTEAEILALL